MEKINKRFFVNAKEVTRGELILAIVKVISDKEPNNSVKLRNKIYVEVEKVIESKIRTERNFTLAIDYLNQFHIREI